MQNNVDFGELTQHDAQWQIGQHINRNSARNVADVCCLSISAHTKQLFSDKHHPRLKRHFVIDNGRLFVNKKTVPFFVRVNERGYYPEEAEKSRQIVFRYDKVADRQYLFDLWSRVGKKLDILWEQLSLFQLTRKILIPMDDGYVQRVDDVMFELDDCWRIMPLSHVAYWGLKDLGAAPAVSANDIELMTPWNNKKRQRKHVILALSDVKEYIELHHRINKLSMFYDHCFRMLNFCIINETFHSEKTQIRKNSVIVKIADYVWLWRNKARHENATAYFEPVMLGEICEIFE